MSDLKIKASLLLSHRNAKHRNDNDVEVSDILFVEKIDNSKNTSKDDKDSRRNIEVIQCQSLNAKDDHLASEEDEGVIFQDKYRPCSSKTTFSHYMKEHTDLHNPSITKLPFVSLLYRQQFQKAHLKRLQELAEEATKEAEAQAEKESVKVISQPTVTEQTRHRSSYSNSRSKERPKESSSKSSSSHKHKHRKRRYSTSSDSDYRSPDRSKSPTTSRNSKSSTSRKSRQDDKYDDKHQHRKYSKQEDHKSDHKHRRDSGARSSQFSSPPRHHHRHHSSSTSSTSYRSERRDRR